MTMQTEQGNTLDACVADVMEAMFYLSCCSAEKGEVNGDWVFRTVRYGGPAAGKVTIGAATETARLMAANFLGEDANSLVEGQVKDIFGETANMICGSWLAKEHRAQVFTLSSPEAGEIAEDASTLTTHWYSLEGQPLLLQSLRGCSECSSDI